MPWRWLGMALMSREGSGRFWGGVQTPRSLPWTSPPPPELPVKILTPDETPYAVVENQTAFLHCRAFGAPAPTVEW